ncbi:MAG TPA: amidohydrolase family protein [Gallionella sp.]|nr:amidohydrolase family protein [Gallionella sp.]
MKEKTLSECPGTGFLAFLAAVVLSGCANIPIEHPSLTKEIKVEVCAPLKVTGNGGCVVQSGSSEYLLIAGKVLAPDKIYDGGGVLITPDGMIADVGCDALAKAKDLKPTQIICPSGVISPGLINAHDHITYDWNYPSKWGNERYDRRNEWRKGSPDHKPITPTPGFGSNEQTAWSELRHVLAGTTSIAGSGGHKGLLRNLDKADLLEGLKTDYVYYNVFPLGDTSDVTPHINDCDYPRIDDPSKVLIHQCYLPHLAEGIDLAANNEIRCMDASQLITSKGAYIHSIAALGKDGELLQQRGASIIWSPRSNISLYGNTAQVTMYSNLNMNIALSTDWTPSGSVNLLRELKCADSYNSTNLKKFYSDRDLWMMVTANPADALHLDKQIGRLLPGLVADMAVYDGSKASTAYRAILDADVENVSLVLRGGVPLYGDTSIISKVPGWMAGCEAFPGGVKGIDKTICIQRELGEDFSMLQLNNADSYPLFFNGIPEAEPTCIPSRQPIAGKEAGYTGIPTPDDIDGDGIPNAMDNCPTIFNPIRPVDNGKQADCNNNGIGDACDPTPCK